MQPSLTDILCTRCGLCCDGSLFADVELATRDQASGLEIMGLEIEDADEADVGLLLQPCRALEGKRCRIYAHRPDCCRTFECRLLQEVKRGTVGVDRAKAKLAEVLQRIKHLEGLIGQLEADNGHLPLKERCVEALAFAVEGPAIPAMNKQRAALRAAMTSVERLIQKTFLGG
jgi:uncharacterized protein